MGTDTPDQGSVLDCKGNALFTNIQERIYGNITVQGANSYTANYIGGAIFIMPSTVNSNYTLNIINLPNIADTTKTYSICTFNASTTGSQLFFATNITVSTNSTIGSSVKNLLFNGNISAIQNSPNTNLTIQQILILNINSTFVPVTNVSQFQ